MPLLNLARGITHDQISPGVIEAANHRSLANLIQSCVLTIFACVWTSIHPNVPGPNDSGWQFMKRRVITMVYAVIAPEIVAIWALRQHFAARKIAAKYNQEFYSEPESTSSMSTKSSELSGSSTAWSFVNFLKGVNGQTPWKHSNNPRWTKAHGFFVQMRGFLLCESSGSPLQVLDYDAMAQLLRQRAILPSQICITEHEIHDRSKGDSISKGVVVLQTTWFIVQALCRIHAGLPLSGVEVLTLAFAVLNGVVYAIWWEKPQGVEVQIPVRMRMATREVGTSTEEKPKANQDINACLSPPGIGVKLATIESWKPKGLQYVRMRDELSNHPLKPLCAFLPMVGIFCNSSLLPLQKMALSENIPTNALRVPMFHADPRWREHTSQIVFAGPIIGPLWRGSSSCLVLGFPDPSREDPLASRRAYHYCSANVRYPSWFSWRHDREAEGGDAIFHTLTGIYRDDTLLCGRQTDVDHFGVNLSESTTAASIHRRLVDIIHPTSLSSNTHAS